MCVSGSSETRVVFFYVKLRQTKAKVRQVPGGRGSRHCKHYSDPCAYNICVLSLFVDLGVCVGCCIFDTRSGMLNLQN